MLKKIIAAALLMFFTAACANQAAFLSSPSGAMVYVDGEAVGVTPCTFDYKNGTGSDYEVVVEKSGYKTVHQHVKADEVDKSARGRWLAAGLVWSPLWLGTFFTKKLKDSYEFVLKKAGPVMKAQVDKSSSERVL